MDGYRLQSKAKEIIQHFLKSTAVFELEVPDVG